jgi:hypothetical protein
METQATELFTPIRGQFLADHHRLEALFIRLLAAFEANDFEGTARLWTEFESDLLTHMQAEEKCLFPSLQRLQPTSARVLMQEHQHFRTRLTELGVALDLHCLRLDAARTFIDELRAHARSEDRLLYLSVDGRLDDAEKAIALRSLRARKA